MKLTLRHQLLLVLAWCSRVLAVETSPNVLILFAADQRADTIAALGNPVIQTPNLDRLVRRGVAFNRAHMLTRVLGTEDATRLGELLGRRIEGRAADSAPMPQTNLQRTQSRRDQAIC